MKTQGLHITAGEDCTTLGGLHFSLRHRPADGACMVYEEQRGSLQVLEYMQEAELRFGLLVNTMI